MSRLNIAQAGDRATLVSLGEVSASELRARADQLERLPDVVRVTIGHSSLYVVCRQRPDVEAIRHALLKPIDLTSTQAVSRHVIAVSFHETYAPDLPLLLEAAGLTREAFLAALPSITLQARYLGFRGGFAYLDGWPQEWALPRRPTSRPVAAGSFAIAGAVAGFYPINSPGGWNILGRTNRDLSFTPGDEIRIEPTTELLQFRARPPAKRELAIPGIELLQAPAVHFVTVQSAFDREAAALAAMAVGIDTAEPLLECALVAPRVRFTRNGVGSWFGSDADLHVNGRAVSDIRQFDVRAGDELIGGRIRGGMRGYLATGELPGEVGSLQRRDRLTIRAMRGPHDIGVELVDCVVTPKLDRVGIRMTPLQQIAVDVPADLPSCGMQCGTLQLHPDGTIVAMGPDHPVTGGYLQPMTVLSSERWKLAQLMPGDQVRFVAHSP